MKVFFDGKQDEIAVYTKPNATYEYDIKNDGYKMYSNDNTNPQIYTTNSDNIMYSVNALPEDPDESVKVIVQIPKKGQVTISASHFYWNDLYSHPMLFDKKNGTYTDMKDNSYSFWSEEVEIKDRFSIVFQKTVTGTNESQKSQSSIYIVDDKLFFNFNEGQYEKVSIYNLQGQKVYGQYVSSSPTPTSISTINFRHGIYLAKMSGKSGSLTHKIIIN